MLDVNNRLYQDDLKAMLPYITFHTNKNCSILITGASGLIGRFLADSLVYYNRQHENKIKIYCLGRRLEILKQCFGYCNDSDNVILLEHDICNELNNKLQLDYIIHAASNADPEKYKVFPVETIKTNVCGTINVLEYAKKHQGTKVIFTSTMEVYGEVQNSNCIKENEYGLIDFNVIRSGYPESKRTSELLCRSYYKQYKVESVIVRLGYIYGPTMTCEDNKAVAQFINNALNNEDIVLKSKGEQRRSYCYVSDACSGILCALLHGNAGEAFNLANKKSIVRICDIAEIIATKSKKKVVYKLLDNLGSSDITNVHDTVLDETKLCKIGWIPKYTIDMGLEHTIAILKN